MAQWLGLPDVEVEPAGDLAAAVAHGLARLKGVSALREKGHRPRVSPVD
ncbi:hypothetical protein J2T23_000812 [Pseudarthrobacter niigatensis]|uniref:Uncharacterized protein n=1 Tax=Pseudarthrobacter niigatensis TaxID=369935 RepID=A0AAJ1WCD1_9MICC|nr:hypothetical protein [Pseudarthrobacter niigatensis]MDQ0264366.1 hypothetical protein [Pseudarthrobacter niigatensis]